MEEYNFIGATPDGYSIYFDEEKKENVFSLLEIKTPSTRKIIN